MRYMECFLLGDLPKGRTMNIYHQPDGQTNKNSQTNRLTSHKHTQTIVKFSEDGGVCMHPAVSSPYLLVGQQ